MFQEDKVKKISKSTWNSDFKPKLFWGHLIAMNLTIIGKNDI